MRQGVTRHLLGVILLLVTACGTGSGERHGGPLVPWTASHSTITGQVVPGSVMAFGIPSFAVRGTLDLRQVELVGAPRGVRLLAARVSFLACPRCNRRPGFVGVNGGATTVCVGRFPPPSFGPTYDVTGLRLFKGDAASLLLYLITDTPGEHQVAGYRVHYRDEHGTRYVIESRNVTIDVIQRPADDSGVCRHPGTSIWTGGTGGKQDVVPLG